MHQAFFLKLMRNSFTSNSYKTPQMCTSPAAAQIYIINFSITRR